ncbi:hypothetical protein OH407_23685, partial [Salmonella enterica]|nr:hypothetical protein [Salmonella enterica]
MASSCTARQLRMEASAMCAEAAMRAPPGTRAPRTATAPAVAGTASLAKRRASAAATRRAPCDRCGDT